MPKEARPASYTAIQAEIGRRIKWARLLVEPNRAAFARAMGVDRTTIQKIEDGERAPSIFNVLDLAHRLRVTPGYILVGSMQGVDGEIAGRLVRLHPELMDERQAADIHDRASDADTSQMPKKLKKRQI